MGLSVNREAVVDLKGPSVQSHFIDEDLVDCHSMLGGYHYLIYLQQWDSCCHMVSKKPNPRILSQESTT